MSCITTTYFLVKYSPCFFKFHSLIIVFIILLVISVEDLQSSTYSFLSKIIFVVLYFILFSTTSFFSLYLFQGVIEYSLTLFFSKLVSYTFLFWLPMYIREVGGFDPSSSADLSAVFDLGGILGGIIAGYVSDSTGSSAITCVVMIALSIPTVRNLFISIYLGLLPLVEERWSPTRILRPTLRNMFLGLPFFFCPSGFHVTACVVNFIS
ncbi:unnamed protein product [Schistosoma mattheei]|uniref:Uncharacterized protein n=1 Tax=Schistosoma mattheei TaxID=31246 RepID=A0A3P7YGY5_9TREM|nr:unnamed protein product [Schistosoma mattheei]